MERVVIVDALRTPIGRLNGSLASLSAANLGAILIKELIKRSNLSGDSVDEVIMGQVLQAGCGQNPARLASIEAGLSDSVPAMTINKVCGSGLKAVHLAAQSIQCGDAEIVIAGGQESMSQAPHLSHIRQGKYFGHNEQADSILKDGLWCSINNIHMGVTAENRADKYQISRTKQDEFAANSQQKAQTSLESDSFKEEVVVVVIPQRNGDDVVVSFDEHPRANTSAEHLAKLPSAFAKEGSVTAGNASGINDGAAALLLMSESKAKELSLEPLSYYVSSASTGVDPSIMGIGPVSASLKCLDKAGWTVEDIDVIEANEAFAAQMLAVGQELGFDPKKLNIGGGAIALGHPIGASGARILVTLIHHLKKTNSKKGLATLCIGGGMGIAMAVENYN